MTTSDFLDAVCDALRRPPGTLMLDDTPQTVEEWDSVGHLSIIATVDAELGVETDTPELQMFSSLRQLVDALKAKGVLENDA